MLTQAVILVAALCAQAVSSSSSVSHGPTAIPHVLHNGFLADTHEVAAAKSAHLSTLSHQSHGYHGDSHGYHGDSHGYHGDRHRALRYHGPTAIPRVLHNGFLADTHEVAAAKSAHLSTLSHQSHGYHGDSHGYHGDSHGYHGDSHGYHGDRHGALSYHGPTAIPHVLHNGFLADTHEVAAAKSAHLSILSHQSHGYHGDSHGYHGDSHGYHGDSHGALRYHGPTAIPHVLHDGHIADTHEVAAAKAEHYAAVAKAHAHGHGGYHHGGDDSGHYASGYDHYSAASGAHHGYSYHGTLAKPVVLPSGYLADTHDVTHAKEHHLQLLNTARYH